MSKLSEKMQDMPRPNLDPHTKMHRVGMQLVVDIAYNHRDEDYLPQKIKEAKRALLKEIFGEFREPLIAARRLIWSGQYKEAEEMIGKVIESFTDIKS